MIDIHHITHHKIVYNLNGVYKKIPSAGTINDRRQKA
jgi:hypothetical protein